jgi:antirestriction protein ArdC
VLSDDERALRREQDRQVSQAAVQALRRTEGWRQRLASRRYFHGYSFSNQLLIALQRPGATRVAGFRAWLKLGYSVRKGEKAIRIWVPNPPSRKQLAEWEAAGRPRSEKPKTYFKLGAVFDREQVETLPAPAVPVALDTPIVAISGEDLAWAMAPLEDLAVEVGCTLHHEMLPEGTGGYLEPQTGRIALNQTRSTNAQAATLVHELGHALVRRDRRDGDPELSYAEEELVVESVAFTVCGSVGLDISGYAIPYLASWAEKAELETIERTAALIDRLAKRIEQSLAGVGQVEVGHPQAA